MSDEAIPLKAHIVARLSKMENWPEGVPHPEHPETHPQCLEVLEISDDQPPKVIYRRPQCP